MLKRENILKNLVMNIIINIRKDKRRPKLFDLVKHLRKNKEGSVRSYAEKKYILDTCIKIYGPKQYVTEADPRFMKIKTLVDRLLKQINI